jgi:membrane peptidoglycan carboxypeptidase
VLTAQEDSIVTSILQGVVREGTGRRAALPDRVAAGKTGTTENYGDAWFVGFTPQLVVAVWVGYPNALRPMLTEFQGGPVAGGTFPAEIWQRFVEGADRRLRLPPESFPAPSYPYAAARRVVWRNGVLELDNGICRFTQEVVYFSGFGPRRTARCKPNEVEVPRVIGQTLASARERLAAQPLTSTLVYKPAKPRQRVDIVLDQFPERGFASSFDKVTLVLAKPLHGIVPRVVGLPLHEATVKLRRLGLRPTISVQPVGHPGRVVWQAPLGGRVAAWPGMRVSLGVGRGPGG